jgi:hypothetical protein
MVADGTIYNRVNPKPNGLLRHKSQNKRAQCTISGILAILGKKKSLKVG